jgi:hypothetical protein
MDKFREKTNLTDKLSIQRATSLMDHLDLHVNPNLLSNATTLTGDNFIVSGVGQIVDCNGYKAFETNYLWCQVTFLVTLDSGIYTLSEDVSGPLRDDGGIPFYLQNSTGSITLQSAGIAVPDDGQTHRIAHTFEINAKGTYRVMFTNAKREALPKLEVGDLATPFTEMGGSNSTQQPASSASGATSSAS